MDEVSRGLRADYADAASALVIADSGTAAEAIEKVLRAADIRLAARIGFAEAAERLALQARVDLILIEADGVADAALETVLEQADAIAEALGAALIVTIRPEQIDLAAAWLEPGRADLLCEPSTAERMSALAVALARAGASGQRAQDVTRERESARLQRLSEEVARIADVLERLTRDDNGGGSSFGVRDAGTRYQGPDGDATGVGAAEVRGMIRARRLRDQFFEASLFADPAWDMLLDLFAAELERRRVSVSSLCIAAAVPPTTALRWIATMHEHGLFARQADPTDRRRAYIGLTAKGLEAMRSYLGAAKRAGLALA